MDLQDFITKFADQFEETDVSELGQIQNLRNWTNIAQCLPWRSSRWLSQNMASPSKALISEDLKPLKTCSIS